LITRSVVRLVRTTLEFMPILRRHRDADRNVRVLLRSAFLVSAGAFVGCHFGSGVTAARSASRLGPFV